MATNQSAKKPANKKLLLGAVIGLVLIAAIVVGICLLQPGESIRFNLEPQVLTLEVGQSRQMELKEGSDSIQLSWSSSSASVVTVDKAGLVTAVAPGEAKIVATASKDGKEYSATARVAVTGASVDKLSVTGDDVSNVQLVNRFEVDTYSSGIKVNKVAGTLTYSGSSNTEIFFAASGTETHARNWEMTGTITKNDMNSSLFPSFGVRDKNGKEQWFCILDNTMALQREWNWWETIQEDDGYRVTKNDAASDFFFHKNPVLNYKVVLEGDVLKVYFGNEAQGLKLAWNLDLTYENYGHFDVGSSYQLAINTVDPCPMVISELDITTSNENKSAGSGKFNVYSVAGSFIPYEHSGKITYPGKGNTELVFAANNWATHAKNWEMTGTITKEDMSKGLFFSFGVMDASGKEQWFCLLNESTLSLQRYWNWYDNRMFTDGKNVIFNVAADAFFGGSQNTSAVLNYKVVLEGDVLKVYFGNDTQNLKLAWNLPLTEKTFGGFRSGSLYQMAINTVDPCPMTISNISVNTRNAERVFKITYEGVDGQPNTNPTSYTHATASTIVLADLPDKADDQFTGWYVNGERILSLKDQAGDITITAGWGQRYFSVDNTSGAVVADVNAGTLTYEGIGNTEVYFKAAPTQTYASDWDMTGFIKKEDINSSLFFSFGVRDSSGKDQWFCFLENGLSRQRYWNWWDTAVWPNNTTIFENSAQYAFFLKTSDVLNYRVSLKDDTLYVYFGSNPQDLQLTWILDLTSDTFGGFAAGSNYQLALNTVDPCAMLISNVSVVGSDEPIPEPEAPDGLFYVYRKTSTVDADNQAGTLTYAGTGDTELFFKADKTNTHAKKWEMTGTITKENASTSLFLSFGVIDEVGREQWFCILNASSISLQRYWNWYDNRVQPDGVNVIENAASTAFFGHASNTSAVLDYKLVLENDILYAYFGNSENELALAWYLPLTEKKFGGFAEGSSYQLAINTVDPCAMVISDVTVVTDEVYQEDADLTWDRFGVQYAKENDEYYGANGIDGSTTLFVGDSFFDSIFWDKFYTDLAGKEAIIAGIGGSTAEDWINYMKYNLFLSDIAPKNLVVNLGNNDIFHDRLSAEQTMENFKKLVQTIHEEMPQTNIYWFSITPREDKLDDESTMTPLRDTNAAMKAWCAEAAQDYITFVDISGETIELIDGIHPEDEYYVTVFLAKLLEAGCEMEITAAADPNARFYVDSKTGDIADKPLEGTLTYGGTGDTELFFKADMTNTHAKKWELTGTVTKKSASTSLFMSFGVKDQNGKDQWFCILNASSISLQRYWNWYDSRVLPDGVNVIENTAATAFFGHENNTSAVLKYKVVLENDILSVYFGNDENELALAWNLPLTEKRFGGFAADSGYQLAINTVDPCAMTISDVSVATDEIYQGELDMDWDWHGANETTERTASYKATGNDGKTTVFIGDSFFSSNWWDNFYTDLAGKDAIIAGISGSTADDWIHYLKHDLFPTGIAPKNLVVNLGNNDIFNDVIGAEEALKNFQKLAQQLHEEMPETNIYWFSITPRTENFIDDSTRIPMEQVNADMKQWCAEDAQSYITFVDISGEYIELQDKIHPKDEYYNTVFLAKLLEAGCQLEALTADTQAKFFVDSKTGDVTDNPRAGTLTYAGTGNTELYFKADATKTHAKNWEMTGTITKANASTSLFMSFGVLDENGKEQWFCILNASSIALQRYWNWYENRVLPDGVNVIENAASTAFFGHENNTSTVLKYKVVLENDILSVYFGNDENALALAWYLPLTETKFGGFTAGSSYQLAINTVDPCPMTITEITAKGSDGASELPEEPEEPEVPVETVSVTWEYARISDTAGDLLYDMGERRLTSSCFQATPGMTITLDDADYQFILYGYTYDAATDTYTYCGTNSFIDCDPDSSSYYSNTYTFGDSTSFTNGNTAPAELYVRILIKHRNGRGAIPESIQDAVTVSKPKASKSVSVMAFLPVNSEQEKIMTCLNRIVAMAAV